MKRTLKIIGVSLLAVLLSCYAALQFIIRFENVRAWVESELSERTGYDVKIASLRLTPRLGLIATGVTVSKDGAVLFQGKSIAGSVLPLDLFEQRIHSLSFEKPVLHLALHDLFRPSEKKAPMFSIAALDIADGEIVLETGHGSPLTLSAVFVSAKNVNLGAETGLQLRADLPGLDGSALLSLSGAPDENRADIVIRQSGEKSSARVLPGKGEEKKVFDARFRMTAKEKGAYEVTGAGAAEELRWGAETIAGEFNSRLEIGPKFESVRWSVDVKTPRFPMKLLPMTMPLESGPLSVAASGDYSAARKTATLHKINVTAAIGTIEGQGSVAMTESPARVAAALKLRDVTLDRLKPLMPHALGAADYAGKIAADVSASGVYNDPVVVGLAWSDGGAVAGEKISLRRLSFKIPFQWARSSLRAKAGRLEAAGLLLGRKGETLFKAERASLTADLVKEPQKPIEMSGDFQIGAGGFSTANESKIGENLNAKGRFTCRDCGGEASFTSETRIETLELLWNKFFGDFKERRPLIEVNGLYRRAADELRLDRLAVSLDSVGRFDLKGSVRRPLADPVFALEIRSDDLRPAGFYDFFVRDTFKAAYPILGQIGLGGKSAMALGIKGSRESFTVEGKLRLEQALIEEKSGGWRVGPVALDLPFRLGYPEAAKETGGDKPPAGTLSIDEIKSVSTRIPKIAVPLILWNNSLRFPQPIRLTLFGGAGQVAGLAWKDVVAAPRDMAFSLELKDLRLIEITETLGWRRFDGFVSGTIPQVHWAGDSLKSEGTMALSVFGGRVGIRALEIERPFSPLRSIKMSAELDGLDLEQASHTFEFGRISGALSGTVENLVITQGQPAEFRADIHTVDKRGVSQWISVEALNKITVVSSGNEAGSLYGGLAGFFDFFRYSKLGFKAALKNDRLTLRGIESKGGQEYLVVGTLLPPTVNIVSYTQEISFSELMRRLERVKNRSGAK